MRLSLVTPVVALAVLAVTASPTTRRGASNAIPITKRANLTNRGNTVNFEKLNSHIKTIKAKIHGGLSNIEKNTGSMHPSDVGGNHKCGAEPLENEHNLLWYGNISVGTPCKPFTVMFDTGSSDLILPSSFCDSSCEGRTLWDPAQSSTSISLNESHTLHFGDGSTISGRLYTDTVSILNYTAASKTLGASTHYSIFNGSKVPDGLMGMGMKQLSRFNATPVFQTFVDQGQVTDPAFSFKLASSGGELYIGGTNRELYIGNFSYASVTHQSYWWVKMDSIQGNGKTPIRNVDAIIDTGTTLIVGPPSQVSTLHKELGEQPLSGSPGLYTFPCRAFPHVSLAFGGTSFPISASSLNLGTISPGSSECVCGIIGWNGTLPFWVVGDVFLLNVYTTFDLGNKRVGFAQLSG